MENKIKRQHPIAFKIKVALAMIKGEQTISQLCSEFGIHPTQAVRWKQQALEYLNQSFNQNTVSQQLKQKDSYIEELYNQIGRLKVELDWLKKKTGLAGF
jgi:putative transposase